MYAARRLSPHGLDAWAKVKQRGYEGLVAKREVSVYRSRPTRDWLKVKVRHEGRFVVVGLDVPLAGACSLLLAARVGRRLSYVGRIEWGMSRRLVAELRESCTILSTPVCHECCCCGEPVSAGPEYELEFLDSPGWRFHRRCHEIWNEERLGRTRPQANGAA